MNRRDFLKALGIGIAAVATPAVAAKTLDWPLEIPALPAYPHFNPALQYGDYIVFSSTDWNTESAIQQAKEVCDAGVQECVPPMYRDKIEWQVFPPYSSPDDPLAQRGIVGWKYAP